MADKKKEMKGMVKIYKNRAKHVNDIGKKINLLSGLKKIKKVKV